MCISYMQIYLHISAYMSSFDVLVNRDEVVIREAIILRFSLDSNYLLKC